MTKKIKRFKEGDIVVSGSRPGSVSGLGIQGDPGYRLPTESKFNTSRITGGGGGGGGAPMSSSSGPGVSFGGISTPVGKVFGPRGIPIGRGSLSAGASPMGGGRIGGNLTIPFKKGGKVKKMSKGGSVSASRRADGCASKGKTKGKFV
jgi:hypothetical protein